MSEPVDKQPMTPEQRSKADLLRHCTFLPASFEKRFARDMYALSQHEDAALSAKQAAFLDKCYWRYRKQVRFYADIWKQEPPPFVQPPKQPNRQKVFEAERKLETWTELVTGKAALDDGQMDLFEDRS
jgi:hypothetical protein